MKRFAVGDKKQERGANRMSHKAQFSVPRGYGKEKQTKYTIKAQEALSEFLTFGAEVLSFATLYQF